MKSFFFFFYYVHITSSKRTDLKGCSKHVLLVEHGFPVHHDNLCNEKKHNVENCLLIKKIFNQHRNH